MAENTVVRIKRELEPEDEETSERANAKKPKKPSRFVHLEPQIPRYASPLKQEMLGYS